MTSTIASKLVEVEIRTLPPGTRFRFHNEPYYTQDGTLLRVSNCSAHVELDGEAKVRQFTTAAGKTCRFVDSGKERTYWAPETLVEALR